MQSQNQNIVMYKNIQNTRLMSNPQHPEKKEKIEKKRERKLMT